MKRIIFAVMMIATLLWGFNSYADDTTNSISLSSLNAQGDTVYVFGHGFGIGVGSEIATAFKGLIALRAEAVSISNEPKLYGLGLGVNVTKLVELAGGTWSLGTLNPQLGGLVLANISGGNNAGSLIKYGAYLTIIKLEF